MNPPGAKRRRLHESTEGGDGTEGTSIITLIHRRDDDIRSSHQLLHDSLHRFGDVVVCAHGEHSSEDFPCISALLASASRPLDAMLFGPLRATVPAMPGADDDRRRLNLRMTEPDHFRHLLRYIHGQGIRACLSPLAMVTARTPRTPLNRAGWD